MSQNQHKSSELWMLKWGFIVGEKYSSRTDVADILKDVLPTYVVKRVTSYMAHPLAGMSREMGEQYFKLRVIQNLRAVFVPTERRRVAMFCSAWSKDKYRAVFDENLTDWVSETYYCYLRARKANIRIMNYALSASRHYVTGSALGRDRNFYWCRVQVEWALYPLLYKDNTKKEILDFAAKQSIKLSMSWTKTKMLMVFNSVYGA